MGSYIAILMYLSFFGCIIWFFSSLGLKKEDKVALNIYIKKYLDSNSTLKPTVEELQSTGQFKCELKTYIKEKFKGKDGYALFLQTPYWYCIAEHCKKFACYKCKKCGRTNVQLDVHHSSYDIHGEEHSSWSLLLVLCSNCHKIAHGKIQNSVYINDATCGIEKNSYLINAIYFYKMGLNITCITDQKTECNSNKEDFFYKAPNHKYEHLFSQRQTVNELLEYSWQTAAGFGIMTGYNNLVVVDIDNCTDDFAYKLLVEIGLPRKYEWFVRSGSHRGFHIYFFTDDIQNIYPKTNVLRFVPTLDSNKYFEKIELLFKLHVIMPPSLHPSGNLYQFVNCDKPSNLPVYLNLNKVVNCVNIFCDQIKTRTVKSSSKR